ncbi:prepilin peptidase [Xylanimonas protaetiae]|nr:A24 family peptidase [Xylanimonas protaetiae]
MAEMDAEPSGPAGTPTAQAAALASRHGAAVLVVAAALTAVALAFGADSWTTTVLVCVAPFAAAAAVIDVRCQRIPTPIVALTLMLALAILLVGTTFLGDVARLGRAILAAVSVGVLYLLLWRFASLGLGDVRLATVLGLVAGWAGWPMVAWFIIAAHLLAAPFAVWQLVRGRRGPIPFGPFLVAGLYLAVVLQALVN